MTKAFQSKSYDQGQFIKEHVQKLADMIFADEKGGSAAATKAAK